MVDSVYIEERSLSSTTPGACARDIITHMINRQCYGDILLITQRPDELLRSVYGAWLVLQRLDPGSQSHNVDTKQLCEHVNCLHMDQYEGMHLNLFFATPEQLPTIDHEFQSMYMVCSFDDGMVDIALDYLVHDGRLVAYPDVREMGPSHLPDCEHRSILHNWMGGDLTQLPV